MSQMTHKYTRTPSVNQHSTDNVCVCVFWHCFAAADDVIVLFTNEFYGSYVNFSRTLHPSIYGQNGKKKHDVNICSKMKTIIILLRLVYHLPTIWNNSCSFTVDSHLLLFLFLLSVFTWCVQRQLQACKTCR